MPYTKTTWNSGTAPGVDAPELNNLETQYTEATLSLEQDLFSAFVLNGLVATKDGTTASQLDITAGVAFLLQTDSTLRRRAPTSSTQSCSGHPSTTLFLDLNPDGTWSFGTAHSGTANYLPIAQVTTDASANILTVTDERTMTPSLLPGASAALSVPGGISAASLPPVAQVNNTNAGSTTTPQVKAATNTGLSTLETTVGGKKHTALIPTEGDGTERGTSLGYTDASGTYHETIGIDSTAGLKFLQTGARYAPVSFFSGSGTGTFNHGLGATPSWVGITCSQGGSSMTVGVDVIGSTTVHVVAGAAFSWNGVAMN